MNTFSFSYYNHFKQLLQKYEKFQLLKSWILKSSIVKYLKDKMVAYLSIDHVTNHLTSFIHYRYKHINFTSSSIERRNRIEIRYYITGEKGHLWIMSNFLLLYFLSLSRIGKIIICFSLLVTPTLSNNIFFHFSNTLNENWKQFRNPSLKTLIKGYYFKPFIIQLLHYLRHPRHFQNTNQHPTIPNRNQK